MTELEMEYVALYQAVPSEGEPLRVDLGDGFGIPDNIPNEEEIRRSLGPMKKGMAPGPSRILVDLLFTWCAAYVEGVAKGDMQSQIWILRVQ